MVWEIWKEHNGRIFDEKGRPPEKSWLNIELHLRETLGLTWWTREDFKASIQERLILNEWGVTTIPSYQGRNLAISQASNNPDYWSPPGSESIKLNFDGAAQGNPKPAGYGGVARDHKGHVMGVYWGDLGKSSNNFAELEGLVHGLCWANINGWSPLLVDMHRVCRGIY